MLKAGGKFVGMTANPRITHEEKSRSFGKSGIKFINPKGGDETWLDEDDIMYEHVKRCDFKGNQ